jgi:hypothetical protein
MSALPPKADIAGRQSDVRFVPKADILAVELGEERLSAHLQTIHLQAEGHSALFLDVRFLGYLDRVERPTALT